MTDPSSSPPSPGWPPTGPTPDPVPVAPQVPAGSPPGSAVPVAPTPPVDPPATDGTGGPGDLDGPGDRPAPHVAALLGTLAGILLTSSLFLYLSELSGKGQRLAGIFLSLLFEAAGVALLLFFRRRRAATVGVTLTAIGVVPLLVFLFVDTHNPSKTFDSASDFTQTATLVLVAAAALWLVAYFFGPARRYAFYLGAALVAVWLVAVVQIVDQPLGQLEQYTARTPAFESSSTYSSSGSSYYDVDTGEWVEDLPSDDQGDFEYDYDSGPQWERGSSPDNPSTRLGWVSLAFGLAYLTGAWWRDRRGDQRMGTAFIVAAIPILTLATIFLSPDLDDAGTGVLAVALGAAAVYVGSRAIRRVTSWYGVFAIFTGISLVVGNAVGDSARASGTVLLLIGLAVAGVAWVLESGGLGGPKAPAAGDGAVPPSPWTTDPTAWAPQGQGQGPAQAPYGGTPTPATAPTGDWSPSTGGDQTAPPTFAAPAAAPWGSPASDPTPPPAPDPDAWAPQHHEPPTSD